MDLSLFLIKSERFSPVTFNQLSAFEEKYNFKVDNLWKEILLFSNGCSVKNSCIYANDLLYEYIVGFLSLQGIEYAYKNMIQIEEEYHYYFSDVLFPIGDAGGSRYLCIGVKEEYKNKLYVINYQDYDYRSYESMIKYLAPNLEELLKMLEPDR